MSISSYDTFITTQINKQTTSNKENQVLIKNKLIHAINQMRSRLRLYKPQILGLIQQKSSISIKQLINQQYSVSLTSKQLQQFFRQIRRIFTYINKFKKLNGLKSIYIQEYMNYPRYVNKLDSTHTQSDKQVKILFCNQNIYKKSLERQLQRRQFMKNFKDKNAVKEEFLNKKIQKVKLFNKRAEDLHQRIKLRQRKEIETVLLQRSLMEFPKQKSLNYSNGRLFTDITHKQSKINNKIYQQSNFETKAYLQNVQPSSLADQRKMKDMLIRQKRNYCKKKGMLQQNQLRKNLKEVEERKKKLDQDKIMSILKNNFQREKKLAQILQNINRSKRGTIDKPKKTMDIIKKDQNHNNKVEQELNKTIFDTNLRRQQLLQQKVKKSKQKSQRWSLRRKQYHQYLIKNLEQDEKIKKREFQQNQMKGWHEKVRDKSQQAIKNRQRQVQERKTFIQKIDRLKLMSQQQLRRQYNQII